MANLGLHLQGSAIKIQAQFRNVTSPKNLFLVAGTQVPSRPETTSRNAPRATSEHFSLMWRGVYARDKIMAKPIQAPGGVSRPSFPIKSVCKACKLNLPCAEH